MSKALVIKGANFSTNKVETITLGDAIPCTALALSDDEIVFTALNQTKVITATKTPDNTTDSLEWSSSNDDVVTVVDGAIVCVGVGTATITAICGTQTATCEVTATHTIILDDEYAVLNGYGYSGTINYNVTPVKDYVGITAMQYARTYYSDSDILGGYPAFVGETTKYAIPIPKGTKEISFTPPEGLRILDYLILVNTEEKQTYVTGKSGNAALGITHKAGYNNGAVVPVPIVKDISEYTQANGFVMTMQGLSSADASSITGKTSVTFSGE